MATKNVRYTEIDLLRTLAIVMMIVYHAAFDLSYFYGFDFDPTGGAWMFFARLTAILFLMLVGVSFVLSWKRRHHPDMHYLKRGLFIVSCGMIITIVTYIIDPQTYIRFGILHCIGVSVMLLPLFRRFNEWNLLIGLTIILVGYPSPYPSPSPYLLPFGFTPPHFFSLDYYPLLPWFGVILMGLGIGHFFYIRNAKWIKQFSIFHFPFSIFGWPGRHALLLYMIHQPIIMVFLFLILGAPDL